MILEQSYNAPLLPVDKNNMSTYPNMLTPPSSNEDSPQPVYFVASPNSSSFHAPEDYGTGHIPAFDIIPQTQPEMDTNMLLNLPRASLHFIEQPTDRFRFRYKSEMAGTHGSLTGINSDKSRKQTYPTVELKNCTGTAIIRCSIYQLNAQGKDFMPHAHRLIMKKGKEEHDDPHDLVVGPEDGWRATFHGMGIIHTAKKNIVSELVRKKTQLKMEHIARVEGKYRKLTTKEEVEIKGLAEGESKSINLNIVCLRFDAFIKQNDILFPICEPIYTHGINNLKSALTGELKIVRLDHVTSPAKGGKEIFVLVERVTKKNIKIRFFEVDDKDDEVWSDIGKFNDLDVHHQYAIVFKTPKFRDENITQPVKVYMELVRPSDNARSEPREFTYVPSNPYKPGSKRPRNDYYSSSSYDSSNMASDELPVVISNLKIEQAQNANAAAQPNIVANSWNAPDQLLTSEELAVAINNIDSDEFKRLFQQFSNDDTYPSIATDAPRVIKFQKFGPVEFTCDRITSQVGPRKIQAESSLVEKPVYPSQQGAFSRIVIKMEVSAEDRWMASRTMDELKSFAKTSYTMQDAKRIIRFYLGNENRTNALHVFVCQNDVDSAVFILKLIAVTQQFDLVNIKNSSFNQTPLQLAVQCHNETLVKYLVMCKAKVSEINSKVNTALHTAVEENVPIDILQQLLSNRDHEKVKEYIDLTNNDGNTALTIAIENKNIPALKLLCMKGSDINKKNLKTGFTPLRVAIERQYLDIIKYILALPHVDPMIADFKDISPLKAAHQRESSREILEVVEKYMVENNLEIDIKEEVEDDSDEEMEEESDVKPEPISPEELKELYKQITTFTPQCLDEVSTILNESGKWEDLAELLDVSHLIRCGIIPTSSNVSKNLLSYAVETHKDTIWEIREFLENLDELRAVEVMDRMVRSLQSN